MAPKIRPLHGFIQVEDIPVPSETRTDAGIILQNQKEPRVRYGKVMALGGGVDKKGRRVFHDCKVGDVVLFDCYMGNQFQDNSYHDGEAWRVVSPDQLLGVMEGADPNNLPSLGVRSAHR